MATAEDTAISGAVSATDVDGDALAYVLVDGPAHGTVVVVADGSFIYTPNADYFGHDSFTFRASDGAAASNLATVTVSVTPVNDAPVVQNGTLTTDEDTATAGTLAATDVGSPSLAYFLVNTANAHGTVTLTNPATGAYSYTPAADYNGPAGFTFWVEDGQGGFAMGSVAITVHPVNNTPVIDVLVATSTNENGIVHLTGSYHDEDTLDSHALTIAWGDSASETVTVSGGYFDTAHRFLDDTPSGTASDVLTIAVALADNQGAATTGSTTTTITNLAPIIWAVQLSAEAINENDTVSLAGSFSDAGTLDTHTVIVNWGDGTSSFAAVNQVWRTFAASHRYLDDSPTGTSSDALTVTVGLSDNDLGSTTAQRVIVVNNVAPTVHITGSPLLSQVGVPVQLGTLLTDPGTLDRHTFTWTVIRDGQAVSSGTGAAYGFIPTAHGTYVVYLTATDDDGGVSHDSMRVVVHPAGGGNVTVTLTNGRLSIEGDQQDNIVLFEAGSNGSTSYRLTGLSGTRLIYGQTVTTSLEVNGVTGKITFDMKQGGDWLFFDGRARSLVIGPDVDIKTNQGKDHIHYEHVAALGNHSIDAGVDQGGSSLDRTDIRLSDSGFAGILNVKSRNGNDLVTAERISVAGKATLDAGIGDNQVQVVDSSFGNDLAVQSNSGDDVLDIARLTVAGNTSIDAGVGKNTVSILQSSFNGTLRLDCSSGDDVLRLTGVNVRLDATIAAGGGKNQIELLDSVFSRGFTATTGSGDDDFVLRRSRFEGSSLIKAGAGNDQIAIFDSLFLAAITLDGEGGIDALNAGLGGSPNANGNTFAIAPVKKSIENSAS